MKISLTFFLLLVGSAWSVTEATDTVDKVQLLYPFGKDVGDVETPFEDDGVSPVIHFSQPYTFYGKEYKNGSVNNNGVFSFETTVPEYTPKAIPLNDGRAFAAVFWADCNNVQGGNISYRQTEDPKFLSLISKDINHYYPDSHFEAIWVLCVTWYEVAFFGSLTNRTNTFQIVLASSKNASYAIINLKEINWTTGTASGGDPRSGLGGNTAQIGFTKGNDKDYFSLPGSRTDAIINVTKTTNVGVEGRWVVEVGNFKVDGLSAKDWEKLKEEDEARQAADAAREAEEAARREAEEAARREQAEREAKEAEEAAKKVELPKEPEPEPEAQKTPDTPEKVPPETEEEEEDEEDCEW